MSNPANNLKPLSDYHRWLQANSRPPHSLAEPPELEPFALTIYRDPGAGARSLGLMVAAYLNEVDPIAPGRWAAFDESSLSEITNHHGTSDESRSVSPIPSTKSSHQQLTPRELSVLDLVSTGSVVLVDNEAHCLTLDATRVFHIRLAGSDSPEAATTRFHLTVNTGRMSQHTAIRVIADSALEWAVQPLHSSDS
jgi:hypothetical protein